MAEVWALAENRTRAFHMIDEKPTTEPPVPIKKPYRLDYFLFTAVLNLSGIEVFYSVVSFLNMLFASYKTVMFLKNVFFYNGNQDSKTVKFAFILTVSVDTFHL